MDQQNVDSAPVSGEQEVDIRKVLTHRGRPMRFINLDYLHTPKIKRNGPCPCGSGKKAKKCHLAPAH